MTNKHNQQCQRPQFLVIEGIEGAGKSTAIQFIAKQLTQQQIEFELTREPGGTHIAEAIRDVLLMSNKEKIAVDTELLLMFAARAQHLAEVIRPALAQGKWVVSDRFTDATYAYQGGGRGVSQQRIAQLEAIVQGSVRPDYVIILDVSVELGMQRVTKRGNHKDRFEQEKIDFFERVRQTYLKRANQDSKRYFVIDANQRIEQVNRELGKIIKTIGNSE